MHNQGLLPHTRSVAGTQTEMPQRGEEFDKEKTSGTKLARIRVPPLDIAAALSHIQAVTRPELERLSPEPEAAKHETCNAVLHVAGSTPMIQASEDNSTHCSSSFAPKDMPEINSKLQEPTKVWTSRRLVIAATWYAGGLNLQDNVTYTN